MSTGLSHQSASSSSVLCVLEEAQRLAYEPELSKLGQLGVELSFEDTPERAFDLIDRDRPDLVVVGMNVGTMEGLEFLAALMGRARGYRGRVLMLPDKGDPFLPQLHARDPDTGKSTTEAVELAALFSELAPRPAPPAERVDSEALVPAARAPVPSPADGPDLPAFATPAPGVEALAPPPFGAPSPAAPGNARRSERAWVRGGLAGLAVLLVIAGAAAWLGSSRQPASRTQPSERPVEPAAPATASPSAPPERAAAPTAEREPAAHAGLPVDLRRHQTLPLYFAKREAAFRVVDERELDSMAANMASAMKERPRARLEVGGHTSKEGAGGFNYELGKRRAEAAKIHLVKRGVPESRVVIKSYEAGLPVGPGQAELDASRRVTVRLLD